MSATIDEVLYLGSTFGLCCLMSSDNIKYVLDLTKEKKFEVICAGFDLVDAIFKIDVPTEFSDRKIAVQAIQLLGGGYIKYGYDLSRAAREEAARNANVERSGDSPPVVDVTAGVVKANPDSPSPIASLVGGAVADENVTVTDEDVTVADENVTVTDENVTVADENVTVTDENITVTDEDVTVADENVTVTDENVTVADEDVTVTDENVTVADENVTENNIVGENESVADESGTLVS